MSDQVEDAKQKIAAALGIPAESIQVVRGGEPDKPSRLSAVANTIAIVQLIEEISPADYEGALNILRGAWEEIAARLQGGRPPSAHSYLLLSEYFQHSGDWLRIRECLRGNCARLGTPQELDALLGPLLESARTQYRNLKAAG